ncbi:sugar ABC transporter substrate-binding protein [Ruegeria atlantica]|uniref:sugar ABC transporter substrate-binding protein n=1 Tax=Ruegeria atlantica TaxID=81569 RepID=UPI00147A9DC7|nr:sugar ABC transporter substrate-binding protein [Ruegeria atlantica]
MKHYQKLLATVAFGTTLAVPTLASAEDKHEIYTLLPQTSLVGLIDPNMDSRADIAKALPESPGQYGDKLSIGWTEITLGNPWFVGLIDDAKKAAEKYGYELDVQVADGDPAKTSSHVDTFIARGVDVIVIDPTDLASAAADAERAVEAGIPVIAIGTVPDESPIVTTVTWNPYINGFLAGRYMATQYSADEHVNAATLIGRVGNSTSESRVNGMVSGFVYERGLQMGKDWSEEDGMLAGFNAFQAVNTGGSFSSDELKFSVLAQGVAHWTEEGGLNAAEDILTAHGENLDLFMAGNDFMGIGALNALDNQGLAGKIDVAASADGFRIALDLVKSGDLMATGLFSGTHVGEATIELIHQIFDDGFDASNMPMGSFLPPETVTPDNVDKFIDPNKDNPFYVYEIPPFKTIDDLRN